MPTFSDCFQRIDFFSEEGKILAAAEVAGGWIGRYLGGRVVFEEADPLSRLLKEGDTDGIIAFLKRELPVCMASIPDHTHPWAFMVGFREGHTLGLTNRDSHLT